MPSWARCWRSASPRCPTPPRCRPPSLTPPPCREAPRSSAPSCTTSPGRSSSSRCGAPAAAAAAAQASTVSVHTLAMACASRCPASLHPLPRAHVGVPGHAWRGAGALPPRAAELRRGGARRHVPLQRPARHAVPRQGHGPLHRTCAPALSHLPRTPLPSLAHSPEAAAPDCVRLHACTTCCRLVLCPAAGTQVAPTSLLTWLPQAFQRVRAA